MKPPKTDPERGDSSFLFPRPKYEIICADPPWPFKTFSEKGKGRSPERHYPTMQIEDIASLPVGEMVSDRAILFLWATWPVLFQAAQVIDGWGFEYRTQAFTWAKVTPRAWDRLHERIRRAVGGRESTQGVIDYLQEGAWHIGTGYYSRANTEVCLLCVRKGGRNPVADRGVRSLIVSPVGRHSEKPEEFYRRVERLYPPAEGRRYLEIFARRTRPGWVTVGNDIDGLDIRESLRRVREEDNGHDRERTKPLSVVVSRNAEWLV